MSLREIDTAVPSASAADKVLYKKKSDRPPKCSDSTPHLPRKPRNILPRMPIAHRYSRTAVRSPQDNAQHTTQRESAPPPPHAHQQPATNPTTHKPHEPTNKKAATTQNQPYARLAA